MSHTSVESIHLHYWEGIQLSEISITCGSIYFIHAILDMQYNQYYSISLYLIYTISVLLKVWLRVLFINICINPSFDPSGKIESKVQRLPWQCRGVKLCVAVRPTLV